MQQQIQGLQQLLTEKFKVLSHSELQSAEQMDTTSDGSRDESDSGSDSLSEDEGESSGDENPSEESSNDSDEASDDNDEASESDYDGDGTGGNDNNNRDAGIIASDNDVISDIACAEPAQPNYIDTTGFCANFYDTKQFEITGISDVIDEELDEANIMGPFGQDDRDYDSVSGSDEDEIESVEDEEDLGGEEAEAEDKSVIEQLNELDSGDGDDDMDESDGDGDSDGYDHDSDADSVDDIYTDDEKFILSQSELDQIAKMKAAIGEVDVEMFEQSQNPVKHGTPQQHSISEQNIILRLLSEEVKHLEQAWELRFRPDLNKCAHRLVCCIIELVAAYILVY